MTETQILSSPKASSPSQDAGVSPLARDRHLFSPGRKAILAIDGGGLRGLLALGFLTRIESLLSERAGKPVRLCDHFDLIGGTSTGAIIASALALGISTKDIRDFYLRMGPRVFRAPWLRMPGWQSKFDAQALREEMLGVFDARTLDSSDLQTGLGVMLKRIDRGGAWILTNNPKSKFWETPADGSFIGNRHYALANVVRASTAAPHYFDPQEIAIVEGAPPAVFVDGGLTPHNDPSIALLFAAILPGHHINWQLGAEKLSVVSIGTGAFRPVMTMETWRSGGAIGVALNSLMQQISESQALTLTLMSWLGKGGARWPINSEIGDLCDCEPPFGSLFRYSRYDARLEADWLKKELDIAVTARELEQLRRFDDPGAMARLDEIGQKAAARQVQLADLAAALTLKEAAGASSTG